MGLGDIVSDAASALVGKKKNENKSTSLQDFLTKFSDKEGKYVNQLNPLNTFEISFKFQPTIEAKPEKDNDDGWKLDFDSMVNSLKDSGNNALKNLTNNLTGGLLGALNNDKDAVIKAHDKYEKYNILSFMHYLLESNLIIGNENEWFGKAGQAKMPLTVQLGYYVQEITVPKLKMADGGGKSTTLIGEFSLNGSYIIPDTNVLTMTFLNTKLPLIERIFYPWMREVTLPYWAYDEQPYTTATITIDFSKHTDLKYVFCGCRPMSIQMITPSQENDQSFKRAVDFLFDYMFITSNLTTMLSTKERLMASGKTLFNSAKKFF